LDSGFLALSIAFILIGVTGIVLFNGPMTPAGDSCYCLIPSPGPGAAQGTSSIILAMGVVEWLRVRGTLSHWAWGLIFPGLAITGGTILLFHLHPVSNFNYLGRNNQPHITEGITAILAGATYLLGEWGIMKQRWWRLVPPALVVLMGVQLILYLE